MPSTLNVPFLKELLSGELEYGNNLLVEFAPDSIWFETSLTIAAQALRNGTKTQYHTFDRDPGEIVQHLTRLGLDVKRLREDKVLHIVDSYTVQTGLRLTDKAETQPHISFPERSTKLSDWSIEGFRALKTGIPEEEKWWLHIDDNLAVMSRYNSDNVFVDWLRTRAIPETRASQGIWVTSLLTGAASDSVCRQLESLCGGIIDFKSVEKEGRIEQHIRVRLLRGRTFDSRWRKLELLTSGEVTLSKTAVS